MTKERINQLDQVAIAVRHMPGCVLHDICDALDMSSSTAGNLLRALNNRGILLREHNGTQYQYTAAPGADIPDVQLPFMLEPVVRIDPAKLLAAEAVARELENRKLWRRAATAYTNVLALATSASEVYRIAQRRSECLKVAKRWS